MLITVFAIGLLTFLLIAVFAANIQNLNQAVLERSPRFVQQFFNSRVMTLGGHENRSETFWVNYQRLPSLLLAIIFAALLIRQILLPK